jgi:hypothetical protein
MILSKIEKQTQVDQFTSTNLLEHSSRFGLGKLVRVSRLSLLEGGIASRLKAAAAITISSSDAS